MQHVKIKMCGLTRPEDIQAANAIRPDYIGFVFAPASRRYVSPEQARALRSQLAEGIMAVGVFVNAPPDLIVSLLERGVIDAAQLHGCEDDAYVARLKERTEKMILQAFRVAGPEDLLRAQRSCADLVLLDAGAGDGKPFDWGLLQGFTRPYFLAGGLSAENARRAAEMTGAVGVDVSSGIETNGRKDPAKMAAFAAALRDGRTET